MFLLTDVSSPWQHIEQRVVKQKIMYVVFGLQSVYSHSSKPVILEPWLANPRFPSEFELNRYWKLTLWESWLARPRFPLISN